MGQRAFVFSFPMVKFLAEFKKFAVKGNAVDLAVGVVIGGAFGKITTSLVNDVVMPPLGLLIGRIDFARMGVHLGIGKDGRPVMLNYGAFINTIIDFMIVAFMMFLVVRMMNRMKETPPPPSPTQRDCPFCLSQIPLKATKCAHCASQLTPL